MPKLSAKSSKLQASPIRKLAPLARAAEARGTKVIYLNIGQPDMPTPPEMIAELHGLSLATLAYAPSEGLAEAREAVARRDFEALAELSESSCLKMHAVMMSARPGLVYWNGTTVECLHCVRKLRAGGVPAFFTIDAGPQVKAICAPDAFDRVAAELASIEGVQRVLVSGLGERARVIED